MNCQLVTGGAGFIGSCYVLKARKAGIKVINLDALTYSGNMENLSSLVDDNEHIFIKGDIGNSDLVAWILDTYRPTAIVNFAAESHVDRSILDPDAFVRTNVLSTTTLLRTVLPYWKNLSEKNFFRFLHVSTDEVFGSLNKTDQAFTEDTPYSPNSPYSASKAASDHMVRAFQETYGLPTIITNCSNNYGPRQFPEKLIPLIICNALARKPLPVYGTGENIRDWLYVEDHCDAISMALNNGKIGRTYLIGGRSEKTNITIVKSICTILDQLRPHEDGSYSELITFIRDRPGHDLRYAVNFLRITTELGWTPKTSFEDGLQSTVQWYLDNPEWVEHILSGEYTKWVATNYTSYAS